MIWPSSATQNFDKLSTKHDTDEQKQKKQKTPNSKCIKLSSKDHSIKIKNELENMVTYQTRRLQGTKLLIIRLVR